MSHSASGNFWSKLRKPPGAALEPPTPTAPPGEPKQPKPVEIPTKKKSDMVFVMRKENDTMYRSNAASFGSSLLTLDKPTASLSWADSMEESEDLLTPIQKQDSTYAKLVAQQAKRLHEAEATISQQKRSIAELEKDLREKADRIQELENTIDSKEKHISELGVVTQEQVIRISELVDEITNKKQSIRQLEKDVAAACAMTQELKLHVAQNGRLSRSDSSTEIDESFGEDPKHECVTDVTPVPIVLETIQASPESKDMNANNDLTSQGLAEATAGAAQIVPGSGAQNLALSSVEFPSLNSATTMHGPPRAVFVTPETLKNVPPPPPAKKLKLGIDPSKFMKKPHSDIKRNPILAPSREDAEPPTIDPTKDIRRMSKAERELYGYGPTVKIVLGTQDIAVLPKYIFMQVSPKAFKHWMENPAAESMTFPSGAFTKKALAIQVEWITMHIRCNKVFSVTLKNDGSDRHNLNLVRCARALGLTPMYMGHFTRKYCEQIRNGPSSELVALIEELAWDETDPIFDCLAHNWTLQYAKARPEEVEMWNKQLTCLPRLSAKIHELQVRKKFASGEKAGKGQGTVK